MWGIAKLNNKTSFVLEHNLLMTNYIINITDLGLAKEVLSMPSFTIFVLGGNHFF